jgi:hypothetical protein
MNKVTKQVYTKYKITILNILEQFSTNAADTTQESFTMQLSEMIQGAITDTIFIATGNTESLDKLLDTGLDFNQMAEELISQRSPSLVFKA